MRLKSQPKTLIRSAALALTFAAAPLALSSEGGVVENTACGQDFAGTCCWELNSICNNGSNIDHQNYYFKESGSCKGST